MADLRGKDWDVFVTRLQLQGDRVDIQFKHDKNYRPDSFCVDCNLSGKGLRLPIKEVKEFLSML